jgi:hypothetical protein
MSEKTPDQVKQLHWEVAQRRWAEEQRARVLVAQMHREAAERHRAEQKRLNKLVDCLHRELAAKGSHETPAPAAAPTVHFTELPEASADDPLRLEWNTYRREVRRLLAEGNEGRHVLIKREQIVGLWDTHDMAMIAGYERFLGQSFLVHQVQERERLLRCVTMHQCRNLYSPSRQAS